MLTMISSPSVTTTTLLTGNSALWVNYLINQVMGKNQYIIMRFSTWEKFSNQLERLLAKFMSSVLFEESLHLKFFSTEFCL